MAMVATNIWAHRSNSFWLLYWNYDGNHCNIPGCNIL